MPDDLSNQVIAVIAETQHMPLENIKEESSFQELGIDSLDGINILFALESKFNINIPDDQATAIRTVHDAVEGVRKLLQGGGEERPEVAVRA